MKMNYLFYINNNKFVCQLVEKLCKQEGISCYTLDQNEHFAYLLNDLKPDVVVVNQDGLDMLGDIYFQSMEQAEDTPNAILMSELEDDRFPRRISEQLDPKTFLQDVKKALR